MRIALMDMDNTLVDYESQLLKDLNSLRAPGEPELKTIYTPWPEHIINRAHFIKSYPGWWTKIPNFQLGWNVYNLLLSLDYEIHVLTKGPNSFPNAWVEKVKWCQQNLGPLADNLSITGDKGLVYGEVLVDDYPGYLDRWFELNPDGLGIMPAHDYNADYTHPNVIRYDGSNLDEVKIALESIVI